MVDKFDAENMNIKTEYDISSVGKEAPSLLSFGRLAGVKVENKVAVEDGTNETSNSADFFETETDQTRGIKTERVRVNSTENPSPEERILSYASSSPAAESNTLIQKEENIDSDDEVFEAIIESNYRPSVEHEEYSKCDESSDQSRTSHDQANSSIVSGLCEEDCGVLHSIVAEDSETQRSRAFYFSNGFKLAHFSIILKDIKSHSVTLTAEKWFSCPHCPAKFGQSSGLKTHLRIHTKKIPFSCAYCSAKFRWKTHLKSHLTSHTDEHKQTNGETVFSYNEQESDTCTADPLSLIDAECSSIELEDPLMIVGNSTSSSDPLDFSAGVKSKTDILSDDRSSKTGNSANFSEIVTDQMKRIKTERIGVNSTENPSPKECILSYASSSCAVESNIFIRKEEVMDTKNEVFRGTIGTNYRPSPEDEERSKSDEEPGQSTTSYDQVDGNSVWGLCVEDCGLSQSTVAEDKHSSETQRSRAYYHSNGFKLAHVSVVLKDLKFRPIRHTVEKRFSCSHCPAKFRLKSTFMSHQRIHTGEELFSCTLCPAKFSYLSSLKRHQIVHTGEKPFSCTYCPAKFYYNSTLKSHLAIHTGEKLYSCTYCPARFRQHCHLTYHLRLHTKEKPFSCTYCLAKFLRKSDLMSHLSMHTGEKLYSCTTCPAKFSRRGHLTSHERIHTNEKPYRCPYCPGKFTQCGTLSNHLRTHPQEKPFSCKYCPARFSQDGLLKDHVTTHTKPFSCAYYPAKLTQSNTLKEHSVTLTNDKPFLCIYCPAKFGRMCHLKDHVTIHTGEKPFLCTYCPAKFGLKSHLKSHQKIHTGEKPFSCSVCSARFSRRAHLKDHLTTHFNGKRFSCAHCPAKFAQKDYLKKHLAVHTQEKRYSCAHCSSKFKLKRCLKDHLNTHSDLQPPATCVRIDLLNSVKTEH